MKFIINIIFFIFLFSAVSLDFSKAVETSTLEADAQGQSPDPETELLCQTYDLNCNGKIGIEDTFSALQILSDVDVPIIQCYNQVVYEGGKTGHFKAIYILQIKSGVRQFPIINCKFEPEPEPGPEPGPEPEPEPEPEPPGEDWDANYDYYYDGV